MKSVYYLNFVPLSDECVKCLKFKATDYQATRLYNAASYAFRDSDYLSVSLDKVVGTDFERVATCDYSFKELKK